MKFKIEKIIITEISLGRKLFSRSIVKQKPKVQNNKKKYKREKYKGNEEI